MDRCAECGFEYDLDRSGEAGAEIVGGCADIAGELLDGAADLRSRRRPEVWSPLEYGCHVRDMLLVQRERVLDARRTDTPVCEPMGRDERVGHDGYSEQEPADVARQLTDAATLCAGVLDRLPSGTWERTLIYVYPTRTERSLRWVAVHSLHEVRHHLMDIRRQLP